jgi:hypothetical protein
MTLSARLYTFGRYEWKHRWNVSLVVSSSLMFGFSMMRSIAWLHATRTVVGQYMDENEYHWLTLSKHLTCACRPIVFDTMQVNQVVLFDCSSCEIRVCQSTVNDYLWSMESCCLTKMARQNVRQQGSSQSSCRQTRRECWSRHRLKRPLWKVERCIVQVCTYSLMSRMQT